MFFALLKNLTDSHVKSMVMTCLLQVKVKPWRLQLANVLQNTDPYGFKRLYHECEFIQYKKVRRWWYKLKINGIVSFNVAFQYKKYKGLCCQET